MMSSRRGAWESCLPETRAYVSCTLAWITVPEGSGTEDCRVRVAAEVPPVGETEGGFKTPVAAAAAGNATIETPMRVWPVGGTVSDVLPPSGMTSAKSPTDGSGIVSAPLAAPRLGVTISQL